MFKNKVQFQKGISLQKILSQFVSEDQCRTTLSHWRWLQGFVCPKCGHSGYCELKEEICFNVTTTVLKCLSHLNNIFTH